MGQLSLCSQVPLLPLGVPGVGHAAHAVVPDWGVLVDQNQVLPSVVRSLSKHGVEGGGSPPHKIATTR